MPPESDALQDHSVTILCPLRVEFDALRASSIAPRAEIICTGPGYDAIIQAAEDVRIRAEAQNLRPEARPPVILASLSGAVNEKCAAGSAWIARSVRDERGQSWSTTWPTTDHPGAVGLSMINVLGADQYFHAITEKNAASRELGVDLVNLEAHALAEWALTEEYHFGVVQAVRESCDEALPVGFESWIRADGSINRRRMRLDALRHPGRIPWMRQMERNCQLALAAMIQLLESFGLGGELKGVGDKR